MKLVAMATVNFQRTEAENFNAVCKKFPHILPMGPNDVVLMVSMARDQMVFAFRKDEIEVSKYGARRGFANVYNTRRVRLDRSSWSHKMLQDYAARAHIELDNFQRLEEQFAHLKEKESTVNVPAKGARKIKAASKSGKVIPMRKVA